MSLDNVDRLSGGLYSSPNPRPEFFMLQPETLKWAVITGIDRVPPYAPHKRDIPVRCVSESFQSRILCSIHDCSLHIVPNCKFDSDVFHSMINND